MKHHLVVLPRIKECTLYSSVGIYTDTACRYCAEPTYSVIEEFNGDFRPALFGVCEGHFDTKMLEMTLRGFSVERIVDCRED